MQLKFSQDLETLLKRLADHPLTLKEILDETSERGFSLMIGLLALPFLFPVPPGFSTVLGSGCLLLSAQMALGKKEPWLPKKIAQVKFPKKLSQLLLSKIKRLSRLAERITRPRFFSIAKHPWIWRINGLCMVWLTILLMLPIPATNPLPTIGLILLAIATLEADGLIMCVVYLWTLLLTLLLTAGVVALLKAPELLDFLPQGIN